MVKEGAFDELADVLRTVLVEDEFVEPAGLDDRESPTRLSPRERAVLEHISAGMINKEIADHMGLSIKTVETFRGRLMKKTGARNTADLVRYAQQADICQ